MTESNWGDRESLVSDRPRSGLWPWLVLAAVALAATVLLLYRPPQRRVTAAHPLVGAPLTALDLAPLAGEGAPLTLPELRGRVALVHFWGPWCGPCVEEFPHLVELKQQLAAQPDFRFVSISYPAGSEIDEDLVASTQAFLSRLAEPVPTHLDTHFQTIRGLALQLKQATGDGFGFPTTVVIDRGGVIRGLWVGYEPGADLAMREVIERALASQ